MFIFLSVHVCVWVQQGYCNLASLPRKDTKNIVKELDLLILKVGFLCAICRIVFLCITPRQIGLEPRQIAKNISVFSFGRLVFCVQFVVLSSHVLLLKRRWEDEKTKRTCIASKGKSSRWWTRVCACVYCVKRQEMSLMKSCVCVCVFVRVELVWHLYTNESVRTCASWHIILMGAMANVPWPVMCVPQVRDMWLKRSRGGNGFEDSLLRLRHTSYVCCVSLCLLSIFISHPQSLFKSQALLTRACSYECRYSVALLISLNWFLCTSQHWFYWWDQSFANGRCWKTASMPTGMTTCTNFAVGLHREKRMRLKKWHTTRCTETLRVLLTNYSLCKTFHRANQKVTHKEMHGDIEGSAHEL